MKNIYYFTKKETREAMKWALLILLHYDVITVTSPSIAGVTYMDNFDFEERYKDVNECNPFYWHPLHLPEMCADMFEKLIRSRIASRAPARVMRPRGRYDQEYEYSRYYDYSEEERDNPYVQMYYIQNENPEPEEIPYLKMLEMLKKDIQKDPSVPKIGVLPNLGPVAIYNQEISKKSENMIKELATAYGKFGQKSYAKYLGYDESPEPQVYVWDSEKNKTKPYKKDKGKNNDKDRITRTKTKHGGVVTIIETINPKNGRVRRRAGIF